jgi:hypothetical protein
LLPLVLEPLVVVTLAAHLICMNYSSAAPLFGVVAESLGGRDGASEATLLARRLAAHGIAALLLGMVAGLMVAAWMWLAGDRGLFQVLTPFAYKIRWAIAELVFYVVCMAIYGRVLRGDRAQSRGAFWARATLAVLAATNLLYHFPPLFAVMARAASQPSEFTSPVGPSEFRALMMQGPVLALTVHFALASLAVVGTFLTWRQLREQDRLESEVDGGRHGRMARISAGIALGATVCQILVGFWVLLSLDRVAQNRLMGGDPMGSLSLAVSVLAAFWLMNRLAQATFQNVSVRFAAINWYGLCAIILVMTWTLHRAEVRPSAVALGW